MQLRMFTAYPANPAGPGNVGDPGKLRSIDDDGADLTRAIERIRRRFGARSVLMADSIITSRRDRMIAATMV